MYDEPNELSQEFELLRCLLCLCFSMFQFLFRKGRYADGHSAKKCLKSLRVQLSFRLLEPFTRDLAYPKMDGLS